MSMNLGLRHDHLLRKRAVQMFEKDDGYCSDRLVCLPRLVRVAENVPRNREGRASCHMTRYDYETKVAAAAGLMVLRDDVLVLQAQHR